VPLSTAEPNVPESCLQAQNSRPPAPTRRAPRRIAKRRIDKAARRDNAAFSHPDRIDNTRPSGKVFVRIVTWITGRCAVRFLSCRHVPDSGGEDVSSLGSSSAEYFGGMAQECVRWLPGRIGPGLAADPGSVTCGPFRPVGRHAAGPHLKRPLRLWPLTATHSWHANFRRVRTGTTCLPPDWIKGLHGAGVGSVSQDEYRRRALECIAVSRLVKNSEYRVLLLDMAQAWLRLADLRRDVRGHCCGYRHADRDRSGEVGAERAPAVLGSGPLGSGSLIATILPDCRPTLNCRLDPRGWGSCCFGIVWVSSCVEATW